MKYTNWLQSVHSSRWTVSCDAMTASICFSIPKPAHSDSRGHDFMLFLLLLYTGFQIWAINLLEWWDYIFLKIIHHVLRLTWPSLTRFQGETEIMWSRLGFKATFTLDPSTPTDGISCRRNPHRQSQSPVCTAQDLFWAPEVACIYLSTDMLKDKCIQLSRATTQIPIYFIISKSLHV